MLRRMVLGLIIVVAFSTSFLGCGCASTCNGIKQRGTVLGSETSDYIVVNYSGGKIIDVWKLKDTFVESEEGSDGWRFSVGADFNMVGGDAKVIRVEDSKTWDSYHEYHYEFEGDEYIPIKQ